MDAIESFGTLPDGQAVQRISIADGLRVELLTYGGLIARLLVPARSGPPVNVVLGLPDLATYVARNPSFGVSLGRYAGRIGGGRFTLDGAVHQLSRNEGDNTRHGGTRGFGKRLWRIEAAEAAAATLAYTSADGEEGFPGTLETRVRFTVDGLALHLDYEATTDAPTVLNLSNHSYFNLNGEGAGDVWRHRLQVAADRILEVADDSIPTGATLDVAGTPFDFRAPAELGARVRDAHPQLLQGLGYDCCYVLRGGGLREVAALWGAARAMRVSTDQPGLQLYTGNKLTGALVGPSGRAYRSGDGVAFETQHYPDSPNRPDFPSTVLRPGETFRSRTIYTFESGML